MAVIGNIWQAFVGLDRVEIKGKTGGYACLPYSRVRKSISAECAASDLKPDG